MQALTHPTDGPGPVAPEPADPAVPAPAAPGPGPAGPPRARRTREGSRGRARPAWGIGAALLALVAAAASGLAVTLLLSLVLPPRLLGEAGAPGPLVIAGGALAQALGAVLVGVWATSPRRGRGGRGLVAEVGLALRPADLPVGLLTAVLAVPLLGLVVSLLAGAGLVRLDDVDNTTVLFAGAGDGAGFLLVAAVVALLAPLWEEVLFRGLLLRALHRRLGAVGAVLLSSAAFGALHVQPGRGIALVLVTGTLGVVLAVLTLRAGRLGPALAAHAAFNGLTVALVTAVERAGA